MTTEQQAPSPDLPEQLRDAFTRQLLAKMDSGKATAADLDVTRKWLQANGIRAHSGPPKSQLEALEETLNARGYIPPFLADGRPNPSYQPEDSQP